MKARRVIEGASYGPDALKVIGEAFDAAWSEIAHHFQGEPGQIEVARERLAHAVLAVADCSSRDTIALKRLALKVMTLANRCGPPAAAEEDSIH
jgi:hypothetical protein